MSENLSGSYVNGNFTYLVTANMKDGKVDSYDVTIRDNTIHDPNIPPDESFTNIPPSHIIFGSESISTNNFILGGTYLTLPGSTGGIHINSATLSSTKIIVGGNTDVIIDSGTLDSINIDVNGGNLHFTSGKIGSALQGATITLRNGGTYTAGSDFASIFSNTTITFEKGGGNLVINGGGTTINFGSNYINNYNPDLDKIILQGSIVPIKYYRISKKLFNFGRTTITLYAADGETVIGSYTVSTDKSTNLREGLYAVGIHGNPLNIRYENGSTIIDHCFLEGVMITTPWGLVPIEHINVGDIVSAWDAINKRVYETSVVWVGKSHCVVRPEEYDDYAGYPVKIKESAIAPHVPDEDLFLTSEHCLLLDGDFFPCRMLVNGESISYDKTIKEFRYYHIKTTNKDIIIANNTFSESYMEDHDTLGPLTSDRSQNQEVGKPKNGILNENGSARIIGSRDKAERVFRKLIKNCNIIYEEPNTTNCSDVFLLTDLGQKIRPTRVSDDNLVFMLPGNVGSIWICSNSSRPCDAIGPYVDDRRRLGILVGDITLFCAVSSFKLKEHLENCDLETWNNPEPGGVRWTTGMSKISLRNFPMDTPAMMRIEVKGGGPYILKEHDNYDLRDNDVRQSESIAEFV